ncbi:MAG: cache domain-containing protein [Bacteriovoracaceae bacterium]|nr:cache domain-containing protein [Bacteriovoracaceae bacterium]
MKRIIFMTAILALIPLSLQAKLTKEMIVNKVHTICEEIKVAKDPQVIFDKITAAEHPYTDKSNKNFYVYVFSESIQLVAHPTKRLVGKNYNGIPDVRGKMFRNQIVDGAIRKGKGWLYYTYTKRGEPGEKRKHAYYELCPNNGKNFAVGSGIYVD